MGRGPPLIPRAHARGYEYEALPGSNVGEVVAAHSSGLRTEATNMSPFGLKCVGGHGVLVVSNAWGATQFPKFEGG